MPPATDGIRAHILARPGRSGREMVERLTPHQSVQARLAGQQEAGRTANFVVFTDGTAAGNAAAQAVLQTAEQDLAAIQAWFGGLQLPPGQEGDDQTTVRTALPLQIGMDAQAGGAYHYSCPGTDIYIEPVAQVANGLVTAEVVEVFEAAQGQGWDCGHTNGEGLSRVLAFERSPTLGQDFVNTEQFWWSNGHADYVNINSATDQDEASNGCATLFLFYLHSQLNYTWEQIVAAGGPTLGTTYQRLTGVDPQTGFQDFVLRVATLDNGSGQLALPANGNPFPIGQQAPSAPSAGSSATPVPASPGIGGETASPPGGTSTRTGLGTRGIGMGILALIIVIFILYYIVTHS